MFGGQDKEYSQNQIHGNFWNTQHEDYSQSVLEQMDNIYKVILEINFAYTLLL